jgi:hypothetical protein
MLTVRLSQYELLKRTYIDKTTKLILSTPQAYILPDLLKCSVKLCFLRYRLNFPTFT